MADDFRGITTSKKHDEKLELLKNCGLEVTCCLERLVGVGTRHYSCEYGFKLSTLDDKWGAYSPYVCGVRSIGFFMNAEERETARIAIDNKGEVDITYNDTDPLSIRKPYHALFVTCFGCGKFLSVSKIKGTEPYCALCKKFKE